jgi:hypothetical protein
MQLLVSASGWPTPSSLSPAIVTWLVRICPSRSIPSGHYSLTARSSATAPCHTRISAASSPAPIPLDSAAGAFWRRAGSRASGHGHAPERCRLWTRGFARPRWGAECRRNKGLPPRIGAGKALAAGSRLSGTGSAGESRIAWRLVCVPSMCLRAQAKAGTRVGGSGPERSIQKRIASRLSRDDAPDPPESRSAGMSPPDCGRRSAC